MFKKLQKKTKVFDVVILLLFFVFSYFLMTSNMSYANHTIRIPAKAWSDFASTIPLIRSFSLGSNSPPEYPLFPGEPMRFHFLFYWLVANIEKIGFTIATSLNILSVSAFFLLLSTIYFFALKVFRSRAVGILSVTFFLFNASLSFLEFFKANPLSFNTLSDIISNTTFPSFGPYDGKIVSAFWNLNIYTNQRHLALAFAAFLFITLVIYLSANKPSFLTNTKIAVLVVIIGLFPFMNFAVWGTMGLALAMSFLVFPKIRKKILIIGVLSLAISIPQILYMGTPQSDGSIFNPGFLVEILTPLNFTTYWLANLGLILVLLPAALYVADKNQRRLFLIFLSLFVIGNLFQFSREIAANHKLFNLFVLGSSMFVANFLAYLWKKSAPMKGLVVLFALFLTLSGIIDIFPIFNDGYISVADIPRNKMATYIENNTPKNSTVLNSSFLYHPASIAGRKIFMGWPYFAWSAGYDTHQRDIVLRKIYTSKVKVEVCKLLKKNNIDYFTTQDTSTDPNFPNLDLQYFELNYHLLYSNDGIFIYSTAKSCQHV